MYPTGRRFPPWLLERVGWDGCQCDVMGCKRKMLGIISISTLRRPHRVLSPHRHEAMPRSSPVDGRFPQPLAPKIHTSYPRPRAHRRPDNETHLSRLILNKIKDSTAAVKLSVLQNLSRF